MINTHHESACTTAECRDTVTQYKIDLDNNFIQILLVQFACSKYDNYYNTVVCQLKIGTIK